MAPKALLSPCGRTSTAAAAARCGQRTRVLCVGVRVVLSRGGLNISVPSPPRPFPCHTVCTVLPSADLRSALRRAGGRGVLVCVCFVCVLLGRGDHPQPLFKAPRFPPQLFASFRLVHQTASPTCFPTRLPPSGAFRSWICLRFNVPARTRSWRRCWRCPSRPSESQPSDGGMHSSLKVLPHCHVSTCRPPLLDDLSSTRLIQSLSFPLVSSVPSRLVHILFSFVPLLFPFSFNPSTLILSLRASDSVAFGEARQASDAVFA